MIRDINLSTDFLRDNSSSKPAAGIQRKVAVGPTTSPAETEADTVADEIMRMPVQNFMRDKNASPDEKEGGNLDGETRHFMEKRFGTSFNEIKIHTDEEAIQMNRGLNARAFTSGNDIYFNNGEYQPGSENGRHLLAHELVHTLQQGPSSEKSNNGDNFIQRKKYSGEDDGGYYTIDDKACTFDYKQNWYFDFGTAVAKANQPAFMASAKKQVEDGWKKKFQLITDSKSCACGDKGFSVDVELDTFNKKRGRQHGYGIDVDATIDRSKTNPVTNTITMETAADQPFYAGGTSPMDIMSHEFGHTLGLEDEYNWWARLMGAPGSHDPSSLMNRGNDLKPWHYQHFADILTQELNNCTYFPEGYTKRSSLREPRSQLGVTTGALFDSSKTEFVIGLHLDRTVSNNAVLGLFYPTIGLDSYFDPQSKRVSFGPTAGLKLSRIVHPLYVDVNTGILLTPKGSDHDMRAQIPLSVIAGLRGKGFNAGIDYTVMYDLVSGGNFSHIIGVNLQFDIN